jgi:hypothetical protein
MPVNTFEIHIRSKDCRQLSEGFNTNLELTLAVPIVKPPGNSFKVTLSSAKIPFSWYGISAHLKTNEIRVNGAQSLVVPDGNYNIFELMDAINGSSFPFACDYDHITNKLSLFNQSNDELELSFEDTQSVGLAKALGFTSNQTVAGSGTVTSTNVVNLHTIHSIYVHSSLAVGNVLTTEIGGHVEQIIDKITMQDNVAPHDMISHHPYQKGPFHAEVQQDVISTFSIALRDQNSKLLQLNGVNFEISMSLEIVPTTMHVFDRTQLSSFRRQIREEADPRKRTRYEEPEPEPEPEPELSRAISMAQSY